MGAALFVFSKGARTGTEGTTGFDFVSASSLASRSKHRSGRGQYRRRSGSPRSAAVAVLGVKVAAG